MDQAAEGLMLFEPTNMLRPGCDTRTSEPNKPVWLCVVVCQFSRAVFVDSMDGYSTDLLLMSLRKLTATYWLPRRIISDSGTQLIGAKGKHYPEADFTWIICPPQAHNFVGGAECIIGLMNRQLKKKLDGVHLTINELNTICLEVTKIVNSHPLLVEDAGNLEFRSIAPSQLLGGRGPEPIGSWRNLRGSAPTHRLTYLQKKVDEFWTIYRTEVLPQLIQAGRWNQEGENLEVDDIVLVINENMLERSYRLGQVLEIYLRRKTEVCWFRVTAASPTENQRVSTRRLCKVDCKV